MDNQFNSQQNMQSGSYGQFNQNMQSGPYGQFNQNMQSGPYGQFNQNMQMNPNNGGSNNKWYIIGGAVLAVLILFTLWNYNYSKVQQKNSDDPTIGVSTTEVASAQDTSAVVEEKTEAEEKEESATAEKSEDLNENSSDTETDSDSSTTYSTTYTITIPSYLPGTTVDEGYISTSLELKFDKPEGFEFASQEELANNDGVDPENFRLNLHSDIISGKIRTEMNASNKDIGAVVQVRVKYDPRVGELRGYGMTDDDILGDVTEAMFEQVLDKEELKSQFGAKEITYTVGEGEFCGKSSRSINFVLEFDGGRKKYLNERLILRNDMVAYIVVLGNSEKECEQYLSYFSEFKI
ncbi:hypothetical protein D6853_03180 [Butyrivibrio sp. X503]|uniref:hypothetical protein n=1 Tax=Butyrivibrio sp. X503 TaxID=2364878 RepID=UPI000EA927B8|nr:hypothetical protein [Butyrivibrio sp. X503]RKM57035.1 hypothetical protein D6853_03180 [Butyrivibrio sp. X503]